MCIELQKVTREKADKHVQNGGGAFFIMDETGDLKQIWDPESQEEVSAAEALFERMTNPEEGGKRYTAFYVGKDGEAAERMESFDPRAGKILLVAPLVRG